MDRNLFCQSSMLLVRYRANHLFFADIKSRTQPRAIVDLLHKHCWFQAMLFGVSHSKASILYNLSLLGYHPKPCANLHIPLQVPVQNLPAMLRFFCFCFLILFVSFVFTIKREVLPSMVFILPKPFFLRLDWSLPFLFWGCAVYKNYAILFTN